MNKDILVRIRGLHQTEGVDNEEDVKMEYEGQYYLKDGRHYICYEETEPGTDIVSKTILKMTDDKIEMIKHGQANAHMIFEESQVNYNGYHTSAGVLNIGVNTTSLNIEEKKDIISADIKYSLEMESQKISDCSINIEIISK